MGKILFFLVLTLIISMNTNAQEMQLAMLQKADEMQTFYGSDALKQALEAAEQGNTIVLGAGAFRAVDITKAVKIFGSGYEMKAATEAPQAENAIYATRLVGDFHIALESVNEQPAKGLYMEGIYSNHRIMVTQHLEGAAFVKCRFDTFDFWDASGGEGQLMTSKDVQFIHCRFSQWLEPGDSQNMSVNNCIIGGLGRNRNTSTILVQNSVINSTVRVFRGILKNSVIGWVNNTEYERLHDTNGVNQAPIHPHSSIYNCVFMWVGALNDVFTKVESVAGIEDTTLFGEHGVQYSDDYMYELTDEAKATYIGTDGKEIGIYGGASPFSPILTIPRIVKKDIAAETVDGKLKVNIKVEAGDNSL